ncbi:expressed unknown protein [Seminavis robusta]|uniref:Uncharacterized protein n=1 Tax=Seminavis robusta TaxID=568900 RepID=A0A9N8ETA6_9STRA|nr:expressed unknown protein [Seminavis robusta]|eukprot:Sro1902_g304420.1 n/a (209) ;mRNA; f:4967-5593
MTTLLSPLPVQGHPSRRRSPSNEKNGHFRLLALLMLLMLQGSAGFVVPRVSSCRVGSRAVLAPTTPSPIARQVPVVESRGSLLAARGSKQEQSDTTDVRGVYNDDAFGLVFLWSSFAGKDGEFAGTFLVLSAIAATATTVGLFNQESDPRIPGAVAVVALLLRPFVAILVTQSASGLELPPTIDVAVTVASVVWGFVNWQKQQETESS